MTTSTREIDFPEDDASVGTLPEAPVDAAPAAPVEPDVEPSADPDSPDCPTTHKHKDGTSWPGPLCSGGCPR